MPGSFSTQTGGGMSPIKHSIPVADYGGTKNVNPDVVAQLKQKDKVREQLFQLLGIPMTKKGKLAGGLTDSPLFGPGGANSIFGDLLTRAEASQTTQRGLVGGFGNSFRNQLTRQFDASLESSLSDLEARGLGASNLRSSTASANEEARAQSQLSLEDALLKQQLDVEQQTFSNIADVQGGAANAQQAMMQSLLDLLG